LFVRFKNFALHYKMFKRIFSWRAYRKSLFKSSLVLHLHIMHFIAHVVSICLTLSLVSPGVVVKQAHRARFMCIRVNELLDYGVRVRSIVDGVVELFPSLHRLNNIISNRGYFGSWNWELLPFAVYDSCVSGFHPFGIIV